MVRHQSKGAGGILHLVIIVQEEDSTLCELSPPQHWALGNWNEKTKWRLRSAILCVCVCNSTSWCLLCLCLFCALIYAFILSFFDSTNISWGSVCAKHCIQWGKWNINCGIWSNEGNRWEQVITILDSMCHNREIWGAMRALRRESLLRAGGSGKASQWQENLSPEGWAFLVIELKK